MVLTGVDHDLVGMCVFQWQPSVVAVDAAPLPVMEVLCVTRVGHPDVSTARWVVAHIRPRIITVPERIARLRP